jgi:hypothetical protein
LGYNNTALNVVVWACQLTLNKVKKLGIPSLDKKIHFATGSLSTNFNQGSLQLIFKIFLTNQQYFTCLK